MSQKKIKILFTIPNFDTAGSGKVVYDLVRNLDKEFFDLEICCFHGRGKFFKEIEKLNVKIHFFNFAVNYYPRLTFPFRVWKIRNFFKENQFDIIHSWHWSSDFSEPLAAKLAGIPYVYTKKSMGWGNKAWKWRTQLSSKIIVLNTDMKRLFFKNLDHKIENIPLSVDTNYYQYQKKSYEAPDSFQFRKSDFMIVSVVNLIPVKGIEVLIQSVLELNDNNIKLCIVGNDTGPYAERLIRQASTNPNIFFLGKKFDVRPYYALADVFVIPTLDLGEGLPVAPMEAMASGSIVIGSSVSGVKDILTPFQKCLFKSNNVASLKDKLLYIKEMNMKDKMQLQQHMRDHIVKEYSQEKFITKHQEFYKNLCK